MSGCGAEGGLSAREELQSARLGRAPQEPPTVGTPTHPTNQPPNQASRSPCPPLASSSEKSIWRALGEALRGRGAGEEAAAGQVRLR